MTNLSLIFSALFYEKITFYIYFYILSIIPICYSFVYDNFYLFSRELIRYVAEKSESAVYMILSHDYNEVFTFNKIISTVVSSLSSSKASNLLTFSFAFTM